MQPWTDAMHTAYACAQYSIAQHNTGWPIKRCNNCISSITIGEMCLCGDITCLFWAGSKSAESRSFVGSGNGFLYIVVRRGAHINARHIIDIKGPSVKKVC